MSSLWLLLCIISGATRGCYFPHWPGVTLGQHFAQADAGKALLGGSDVSGCCGCECKSHHSCSRLEHQEQHSQCQGRKICTVLDLM